MSCKHTKKPFKSAGKVKDEGRRRRLEAQMKANLAKRKRQVERRRENESG